jgi:hypothetical protein
MTLKISHGAFGGMCSEFHDLRCDVARAAGYRIERTSDGEGIVLPWDAITDGNISRVWPMLPTDPLLVLLAHSDVGGEITPADGLRLADRLTELLIPSKWAKVTKKFVAACRLAGHRNEPMEFVWDPAAMMQRLIEEHLREKLAAAGPGRFEVRIPDWMVYGSTVH